MHHRGKGGDDISRETSDIVAPAIAPYCYCRSKGGRPRRRLLATRSRRSLKPRIVRMQKIFTSADRLPSASRGLPNNEHEAHFRNFAVAILALPRRSSSGPDDSSRWVTSFLSAFPRVTRSLRMSSARNFIWRATNFSRMRPNPSLKRNSRHELALVKILAPIVKYHGRTKRLRRKRLVGVS